MRVGKGKRRMRSYDCPSRLAIKARLDWIDIDIYHQRRR